MRSISSGNGSGIGHLPTPLTCGQPRPSCPCSARYRLWWARRLCRAARSNFFAPGSAYNLRRMALESQFGRPPACGRAGSGGYPARCTPPSSSARSHRRSGCAVPGSARGRGRRVMPAVSRPTMSGIQPPRPG